MIVNCDRDSVCMGDDCMSHKMKIELSNIMITSMLLMKLSNYVPRMKNVVWAILSLNTKNKVIGYIVTDDSNNSSFELTNPDTNVEELFIRDIENISVYCRYYHQGTFSWIEGKTGKHIEKHINYPTLLEKVKHEYN